MTDEDQIRNLQGLWAQRDADKNPQGWSELFTEDGTNITASGRAYRGRAAIAESLADRIARNPPDRNTTHVCGPSVIRIDGDTANTATDYVAYGRIGGEPWEVMSIGRLHARLVRDNGTWLFQEMHNRAIGPSGGPSDSARHPSAQPGAPT